VQGFVDAQDVRDPLQGIAAELGVAGKGVLQLVTDFLDVGSWPAFNLADSFIVIGVAILVAALAASDRRPRQPTPT